jgi:hypothetical protein
MSKKNKLVTPEAAIVPHENCEQCNYWNNPERQGEEFHYAAGFIVYDVEKARGILAGRTPEEVETSRLAGFVAYPKLQGTIEICKHYVNESHIDHVNPDEPIILACVPRPREGDEDQSRPLLPIDGSHRIARAIKDGKELVKVVCLSEEESDEIITDHRNGIPKLKKKKKKE